MFLKCNNEDYLTESEQNAINYINEHAEKISDMTITEIAQQAFVSTSTVSRAIRKCGLESMSDVRYQLAMTEMKDKKNIYDDILNKTYTDCMKTIERIDTDAMKKLAKCICKARIVHILATNAVRFVAEELAFILQSYGVNACVQYKLKTLELMRELVQKEDLVIVMSLHDDIQNLLIGVQEAKGQGVTIVSCCCEGETELNELSDVVINAYTQQMKYRDYHGEYSRLGLQIVIRTIAEYLQYEKEVEE